MIPAGAMWWTSSCGRIEFQLLPDDAARGAHSGQCDRDIKALREVPYIKAQLADIAPAVVASDLREHGAWDDAEVADHDQNLSRLLWIACGDITEETR